MKAMDPRNDLAMSPNIRLPMSVSAPGHALVFARQREPLTLA